MIVILVLCLAVGVIVVKLYRDLASLRTQLNAARAQIDVQLAHRTDLLRTLRDSMSDREKETPLVKLGPSIVGQNLHSLLADVKAAEEKIAFARDYYNQTARAYDTRLREFPYSVLASSFGMEPKELLELNFDQP